MDIKKLPLPTNWRQVHPTTYVHVDDLITDEGKYRTVPVKIDRIELHEIVNPKTKKREPKLVAIFTKGSKGLILNATMNKFLQEFTGSRDPHKWAGVDIELFVEHNVPTPQGKQSVPRIRAQKGSRPAPKSPAQAEEEGNAIDLSQLSPDELDALLSEEDTPESEIAKAV